MTKAPPLWYTGSTDGAVASQPARRHGASQRGTDSQPSHGRSHGATEARTEYRGGDTARTAHRGREETDMAQNTRRARREATREEFAKARAEEFARQNPAWRWKSKTFYDMAMWRGNRTEDGWREGTTQMSDAEIFEILGLEEELETETEDKTNAEDQTTEISETDIEEAVAEAVAEELAEEQTQAQKWEQDANTEVREAWQRCWEYVRASRIGCCTELGEGAMELALELARALGCEEDTDEEWEQALVVLDEMDRLL